jgi:hypothetical protein
VWWLSRSASWRIRLAWPPSKTKVVVCCSTGGLLLSSMEPQLLSFVLTPSCGPRSRQHPIGKWQASTRAVNLVDRSLYDVKVIKKYNPRVQWLMENPYYSKFTSLLFVQPYITSGRYLVIQYKDYDVTFFILCSVKRARWLSSSISRMFNEKCFVQSKRFSPKCFSQNRAFWIVYYKLVFFTSRNGDVTITFDC